MDVIKITPEELTDMAYALHEYFGEYDLPRLKGGFYSSAECGEMEQKLLKLAAKLEADNLDALAFCAPAQGVQA
ncbi:hypothetical protein [Alcanivorax sp. NBRC 102024]|uniref:hypothetical protein n=1 Tax=Alcanivorax sp. NBRC 102024 TaxID=1113895 RepID=UPI000789E168|nr:hypothetical protein [Alcanivorax sp. NBRC 102024]